MRTARIVTAMLAPCLAFGLLAACGGGGGGGSTSPDPVAIPVPPPSTPPTTTPPPTEPPPTTPPPTTPPPTEPPPTDPPPTDPPPTQPPPTQPPSVPPLPTFPSYDGYEGVHGVAVDPHSDTVFAIRGNPGELTMLAPESTAPQPVGVTGLGLVRALTFDGPGNVLLAVTDGAAGSDDILHAVNPLTAEALELGTITGYSSIEALAFHGEGAERKLYALDTEQDVLLSLNPLDGLPTLVGALGAAADNVLGLASTGDRLVGVDGAHGQVVTLDPTSGTATKRVSLALGGLRGCAWSSVGRMLLGVAPDDKLHRIDLEGRWIGLEQAKGLAPDASPAVLYGAHAGYGLVFRSDVETGWRQPLVQLQDTGLEGLAFDAATTTLYALSRTSGALFQVTLDGSPVVPPVAAPVTVQGPQGAWTGLTALTFARGKLYAVDATSATVVRITPATGLGTSFTTITGHGGLQSLAYDGAADRLLLYADTTRSLLQLPRAAGAPADVVEVQAHGAIGGLAWLPDTGGLLGSELTAPAVVTLLEPSAAGLGYDEIHALSMDLVSGELTGFDATTEQYVVIDQASGVAQQRSTGPGLQIEGLAHDHLANLTYGVDAATGSLYTIGPDGVFSRVGTAGALAGVDVRALAFDPGTPPGVLYGFDNTARTLVRIDLATAVPTAVGAPLTYAGIEALAFMLDTATLLAIDRPSRMLLEIDPATGLATDIIAVALTDVRGMTGVSGTDQLFVIDATLDEVVIVDRFTGSLLEPFAESGVHRGGGNAPIARLLWPRGDVRAAHAGTLAIELSIDYGDDAQLVLRDGKQVLFKKRLEADDDIAVIAMPSAAKKALAAGKTLTWGLDFRAPRKPIQATCKLVPATVVRRELMALAANAYLRKQKAHVIHTRAARVLLDGGHVSEALIQAAHAASLAPEYVPAKRTLIRCGRALFGKGARDWSAGTLVRLLGSPEGPWKLLGLPKPAAK